MKGGLGACLRGSLLYQRRNPAFRTSLLHTSSSVHGPSVEATQALDGFNSRYNTSSSSSSEPTTHYFQHIDANQVHLTRLTLSSMIPLHPKEEEYLSSGTIAQKGLPTKTSLIPSEHLCFFTPRVRQSILGKDGSDTSFNPPGGIFTRRMWAGGEMIFEKDNPIQIDDQGWEKTTVEEAKWKELKNGRGEMIVVWVKKEIGNEKGLCLTDRRSWVFQPKLAESTSSSSPNSQPLSTSSTIQGENESSSSSSSPPESISSATRLVQDASNLFRYSALTFNAHAIHLNTPWAQQVEGHPNIVVHGPLNLSLLLRKWGRERAGWTVDEHGRFVIGEGGKKLHKVQYRAMKPVHANHPYWIGFPTEESGGAGEKVLAVKADGQIAMEANITAW
jgi:hydroxyacyl-ACP dehydratase HTD2-like protein with hotdog domain